jgi:hypothetical protein
LVEDSYCNNPDCHCNSVVLSFTELEDPKRELKNPLAFSVCVDLESWEELRPPSRTSEISGWVREFLQQCSSSQRDEYKASYEESKRIARRKAAYILDADEVLDGAFVSYADISSEQGALSAGGNAYTFDVDYQGREFLVEDLYCPNPDCDCKSVHLDFFEAVPQQDNKPRIYHRFMGKVTFAGELAVERRTEFHQAEAKAVLSAWWNACQIDLAMLKDRYQEVKEIGRRSLRARSSRRNARWQTAFDSGTADMPLDMLLDTPLDMPLDMLLDTPLDMPLDMPLDLPLDDAQATNIKVRRNALCPCGSGKKYKKCCGRKTA